MERPSLPPVPPGRSALPCFVAWEEALRARLAQAEDAGVTRVTEARTGATRVRAEGEVRLKRLVLEAEERAMREAEDRARDRISDVRARTQRWVEQAEEAARAALDDALDLLCRE